jgi:hypothetical protein
MVVAIVLLLIPSGFAHAQASPGISVSVISGSTTELGGTATFSVVLTSQPTANVVVGLKSLDATEGKVSPATLTFTPSNWSTSQPVLVQGVDDFIDDGDVAYTIALGNVTSADANYNAMTVDGVSVKNTDNDTADVRVTAAAGLTTSEAGTSVTFKVVLNSQPAADVSIALTSSDLSEGTVSPASLVFTPTSWNVAKTVTVKGANDFDIDGTVAYSIVTAPATSTDPAYAGMNASDVNVSNTDNDIAGLTVTPVKGLITTEAGGTASFKVALTSNPTSDVTISLSSSNTAEGTVSPAMLTFTPANARVLQTVTVKGVNDGAVGVVDGAIVYNIVTGNTVSNDANYNGKVVADVEVSNQDDETVKLSASRLTVNESAGSVSLDVILTGTPVAGRDVSVTYATRDGTAKVADGDYTAKTATLTFVAGQPLKQTITVPITNDTVGEAAETFVLALSAPVNVALSSPAGATLTIAASDVLTFSATSFSISEAGKLATITVKLNGPADQTVSVNYATSNGTAIAGSDYTAATGTLLFAPGEVSKTFTVAITNDTAVETSETITLTLSNAVNATLGAPAVTLTIVDND